MKNFHAFDALSTTLILGGVRSGKSAFAEKLCLETKAQNHIYIATAHIFDDEMHARVKKHQARRKTHHWHHEVECPFELTKAISRYDEKGNVILIDCLTFWLTNHFLSEHHSADIYTSIDALADIIMQSKATIIMISNEIGLGGIAEHKMTRQFADIHGEMNQKLAQNVEQAILVTAGLPLKLK